MASINSKRAGVATGPSVGASAGGASSTLPAYSKSFDEATYGFRNLEDFQFGTKKRLAGPVKITDVAELNKYFDYWAYNLSGPTATINVEVQRYVDFTNAENFVFTDDALELRATLPNGTPVGLSSTTISSAVTYSRTVTVADASNINIGQLLSFGPTQHTQMQRCHGIGVRGTIAAGYTLGLRFSFNSAFNQSAVQITVVLEAGDTIASAAQKLVDAVNADATLASYKITAAKLTGTSGGYLVTVPRLESGLSQFGDAATGSYNWVGVTPSLTGTGLVHERKQDHFTTFVLDKSGNTLTLSHPVTAASGATIYVNPTKVLWISSPYVSGSATIAVPDVGGLQVGQGVQFAYQDNNIRRIGSIDTVAKTINVGSTVYITDGTLMAAMPVWLANANVGSTGSTVTFNTSSFPAGVRVGQQVHAYNINPNHNIKVTGISVNGATTTVTLSGNMAVTTGNPLVFHEPVQSAQIWSRFGITPGADGNSVVALELEVELPSAAALGAWPAFWIFTDPSSVTGQPAGGNSEIDMLEQFNYFGNSSIGCYSPSASTPLLYGYGGKTDRPMNGNDVGIGVRKIQVIFNNDTTMYYYDGVLMFVKAYKYRKDRRAQVAANLAVGVISTGMNSNGFFPIDMSQFPMAMKLRRMRVLAA